MTSRRTYTVKVVDRNGGMFTEDLTASVEEIQRHISQDYPEAVRFDLQHQHQTVATFFAHGPRWVMAHPNPGNALEDMTPTELQEAAQEAREILETRQARQEREARRGIMALTWVFIVVAAWFLADFLAAWMMNGSP